MAVRQLSIRENKGEVSQNPTPKRKLRFLTAWVLRNPAYHSGLNMGFEWVTNWMDAQEGSFHYYQINIKGALGIGPHTDKHRNTVMLVWLTSPWTPTCPRVSLPFWDTETHDKHFFRDNFVSWLRQANASFYWVHFVGFFVSLVLVQQLAIASSICLFTLPRFLA